jgi:predicted permease
VLLASLDPSLARYDQPRTDEFYRQLEDRLAAIPGVRAVGQTSYLPLSQDGAEVAAIVPEGIDLPAGTDSITAGRARVDAGYFDAIGIPIVAGRRFDRRDTADSPRVAIVNRGMADRFWPGQNAVGKRLRLAVSGEWAEIVGVAANHKFRLFTQTATPFVFVPRVQQPLARSTLVIRTTVASASVSPALRASVAALDPAMPIVGLRTMEDYYYANAKNLNVVVVRTIAAMGAMGLVLALIGLYGLMAYAVSRRRREIGIRMAVGAQPASVLYLFLRQATVPPAVGVVAGVVISAAVGNALQSVFPGTGGDAVTYLLVVPLVVAVAMLAAYVPVRAAARIDPVVALRAE